MKAEKIINFIGYVLCVVGPILFFWNLGRLAQGTGASIPLLVVGLVLSIIGLFMGNAEVEG